MPVVVALTGLAAVAPLVLVVFLVNRRDRRAVRHGRDDSLQTDEQSYGVMNRQGLGWGTRDNDRGGL